MKAELSTIKDIAAIATPFINLIIKTWLEPKLSLFIEKQKINRELFEHGLINKFSEYLSRSYEKQSYLRTVVFQNQQKLLEELYLPLKVKLTADETIITIDSYRPEFIPRYKRVLLVDTAGMGKSTILRFLFLHSIRQSVGIPIFIELRQLQENRGVLEIIYDELNPIDNKFNKELVLKLIRRGDFLFFLDGYDEIPFTQRDPVTNQLQDFISKAGSNFFIISSREEGSLASFADFQRFTIEPLQIEEAFELLRKYDHGGTLANEIISKLEGPMLSHLQEFLKNPLLVSLLFKSYEYKQTIPIRKHIFYRQVYDALFESHDLAKGGHFVREKRSGLDIDAFHRILRALGYRTFAFGKVEYSKDDLVNHIAECRKQAEISFGDNDFLDDLLVTVPIFLQDGNMYRWNHKSIQEYFAAQFICVDTKDKQKVIFEKLYSNSNIRRFENILGLCYDIDYKAFRNILIYRLIKDVLDYYDRNFPNFDRASIPESLISERVLLNFARRYIFFPASTKFDRNSYQVEIRKIHEKLTKENIVFNNSIMGRIHSWDDGVVIVIVYDPPAVLMDILRQKNDPLVYSEDWQTLSKAIATKSAIALRSLFANNEPLILTEDPKIAFNERYFEKINVVLRAAEPNRLNIEVCKDLFNKIEEDVKREQRSDFLTEFL